MAEEPEEQFSICPIDLSRLLERLDLGITEAAQVCGVSMRQLLNWTNIGYVQCQRRGRNRIYGRAALERVFLIKQGLANGLTLRRAAKAAESFLTREAQEQAALEGLSDEELRSAVAARADRLGQMADRIRGRMQCSRVLEDTDMLHETAPEELGKLVVFLESHPYKVHTARQLAERLGRPAEEVTKELDLLADRRFLHKFTYPNGAIYRYYPPRRTH